MNDYNAWETDIANAISNLLDCDYGDASGVIEANPLTMAQAWAMGLDADQTANKIVDQYPKI